MTQDEIIEMAEQCGIDPHDMCEDPRIAINNLERFAKLVAAKEREACAKLCEELAELSRTSNTDSMWEWGECAAAIRARSNV